MTAQSDAVLRLNQSMQRPSPTASSDAPRRLDSWKEIAAFFGRDERTVKRWEKERGLPIHRLPGTARAGVFAFTNELSGWLKSRESAGVAPPAVPEPEHPAPAPPARQPRTKWGLVAVLASVALAAVAIALNYPLASRQAAAHAINPEAEDLYLKGRYYWNKRTPDDLNKAVDLFTQAIVHDPGYAKAYAGLADTYNLLREFSLMPSNEAFSRSEAAARRAVELDSSLADAHNSLAFALFYGDWDFDAAEREFRRAIDLDPNYATAFHWYGNALGSLGRYGEALANINRARELDPHSASILADRGLLLVAAGSSAEGIAQLKQVAADDPSFQSPHAYLSDIYLLNGEYAKYLAEARTRAELSHDTGGLAVVAAGETGLAAGGNPGMLQAILEAQTALYEKDRLSPFALAKTFALMGKNREAIKYLRAALEKHDLEMVALGHDPFFAALKQDPAFTVLLSRIRPKSANR